MTFLKRTSQMLISTVALSFGVMVSAQEAPAVPSAVAGNDAASASANNRIHNENYEFSDWTVNCIFERKRDANNAPTGTYILQSCSAQEVFEEGGNIPLVVGTIYQQNPQTAEVAPFPSMYMVAPLGVFLAPIELMLDENPNKVMQVPFRQCIRECNAAFPMNEAVFNDFKNGGKADIRYALTPEMPWEGELSLSGFTAANEFLKATAAYTGKEVELETISALAK